MFVRNIPVGASALAAFFVLRSLFMDGRIPVFHHDWAVPVTRLQMRAESFSAVGPWLRAGFGEPNFYAYAAPLHVLDLLIGSFFSPLDVTRIVLFSALTIAGAATGACVSSIGKTRSHWPTAICGSFSSVALIVSPYVGNELGAGHIAGIVGLAGLAMTLLFALQKRGIVPVALSISIAAVQVQLGLFALLLSVAVGMLDQRSIRYQLGSAVCSALSLAGTLCAGLLEPPTLWLRSDLVTQTREQAQSALPLDALAGLGYSVGIQDALLRSDQLAHVALWAIAAMAAIGYLLNWRRSRAILLLVCGVMACCFQMGLDGPLGMPLNEFFTNIPAASLFRELYHFASISTLAVTIGLGIFLTTVRTRIAPIAYIAATIILGGAGFVSLKGSAVAAVPRLASSEQASWQRASEIIAADPTDSRVFMVPTLQPLSIRSIPDAGTDPYAFPIGTHDVISSFVPDATTQFLARSLLGGSTSALRTFGIGYVVVRRHWISRHYETLEDSLRSAFGTCSDPSLSRLFRARTTVYADANILLYAVAAHTPDRLLLAEAASDVPLRASVLSDDPRAAWVDGASWIQCTPIATPLTTLLTRSSLPLVVSAQRGDRIEIFGTATSDAGTSGGVFAPARGTISISSDQRIQIHPSGRGTVIVALRRPLGPDARYDLRASSSLFSIGGRLPRGIASTVPAAGVGATTALARPTWRYYFLAACISVQCVPWLLVPLALRRKLA